MRSSGGTRLRLKNYVINLMTMDYGSGATSSVCVVVSGSCEMGQSAIQAGKNLEHHLRNPGEQDRRHPNDRPERQLQRDLHSRRRGHADYLRGQQRFGRAALLVTGPGHALPLGPDVTSPTCNSVSGTTALEFTNRFLSDLGS